MIAWFSSIASFVYFVQQTHFSCAFCSRKKFSFFVAWRLFLFRIFLSSCCVSITFDWLVFKEQTVQYEIEWFINNSFGNCFVIVFFFFISIEQRYRCSNICFIYWSLEWSKSMCNHLAIERKHSYYSIC